MSRHTLFILLLWLTALAAAFALDRPVAQSVHDRGWDLKNAWTTNTRRLADTAKSPGEYWFTLAAAALTLLVCSRVSRRRAMEAGGLVAASGVISGVNGLVKWVAGRKRPITYYRPAESQSVLGPFDFHPFISGFRGLFGEKDLCFPSGHTCLAFATAGAFAILLPRWRWLFFAVATVTGIERIVENAHFLSDVVAGAGLGLLSAQAAHALVRRIGQRADSASRISLPAQLDSPADR
jgi:membrane-associated phospholipid phosphatase